MNSNIDIWVASEIAHADVDVWVQTKLPRRRRLGGKRICPDVNVWVASEFAQTLTSGWQLPRRRLVLTRRRRV